MRERDKASDGASAIVGDLSTLNGGSHVASITATSGAATLKGGEAVDAPAFGLTGSGTVLTLAEILSYAGDFGEGKGAAH